MTHVHQDAVHTCPPKSKTQRLLGLFDHASHPFRVELVTWPVDECQYVNYSGLSMWKENPTLIVIESHQLYGFPLTFTSNYGQLRTVIEISQMSLSLPEPVNFLSWRQVNPAVKCSVQICIFLYTKNAEISRIFRYCALRFRCNWSEDLERSISHSKGNQWKTRQQESKSKEKFHQNVRTFFHP